MRRKEDLRNARQIAKEWFVVAAFRQTVFHPRLKEEQTKKQRAGTLRSTSSGKTDAWHSDSTLIGETSI